MGFMRRALLAGVLVGASCGALGVVLLLRRGSLIGEGLAHFSFGCVGLAVLLGWPPLAMALPLAAAASLAILRLPRSGSLPGDAAIGMVAAVGLAGGVALAAARGGFRVDLFGYLFGDVLTVPPAEVGLAAVLALSVAGVLFGLRRPWLALAFDPAHAEAAGLPTARMDRALAVLTAVTVVLGIRLVGSLLISAMLIFPAATALRLAGSFSGAMGWAMTLAAGSVAGGLLVAAAANLPAGAAIVLIQAAGFAAVAALRRR